MKKAIRPLQPLTLMTITGFLLFLAAPLRAQDPFQDAVKQLNSSNVRGYLQPFVTAFGADMNSGLYRSADISDVGISIRLDLVGMGTLIGDAEKTFMGVPPPPFPQSEVQTATVYGGLGTVVNGPGGTQYQFQNGQVNLKASMVLMGVPQLTVGNIFGTQAVIRYIPFPEAGNFPKFTVFGAGLRHSISRYLPTSPVDLAASAFYEHTSIGDLIDAKAFSLGAQASKSFSVLTIYGGLQYETSTMTLSYTYTGYGAEPNSTISLDMDGDQKFRATLGVGLNLVLANLSADVSVGSVTTLCAGLGFGL